MNTQIQIDYDDAKLIVNACERASAQMGIPVSVAVLDAAGHILLLARLEGASFQTPEVARGKALTSVMMKKPSADIETATLARLTLTTFSDGRLPMQGGVPIFSGAQCIGAVGVSGGTSVQDELIAQSGVEALTAGLDGRNDHLSQE